MKNNNNWKKELDNLLTKMSEEYLIDDEFGKQLEWFITNALQEQRDEGFKQGFEDCRKDIREGKHLNCCYKKDLTNALNQQRINLIKEILESKEVNALGLELPFPVWQSFKEFLTKLEK